ncbi:hypothetical protein K443DRAFT_14834 [Laccaria amethystina LaAM-08-1]|uniref:Uncharacterized protein n=1 Tax=Laccaria amethystina LaAM-08-1 TaxID=1095629 RepID=A0A0C9WHB9_9AGAR|nr:hypothetical protein K443DRAFT_14834 [Laccaria amethystina LaAM-08-1]
MPHQMHPKAAPPVAKPLVTRSNPPPTHGPIVLTGTLSFLFLIYIINFILKFLEACLDYATYTTATACKPGHCIAFRPTANPAAESMQQEPTHTMPQCRSASNAAGAPTPQPGLCEPSSESTTPESTKITAEVHSAKASSTPSAATHTETPAAPAIVNSAIAATAASCKMPSASKTPRSLCKIEWCKNVGGSNSEFVAYWKSLKGMEEEKRFIDASAETTIQLTSGRLTHTAKKPGRFLEKV